MRIINPNIRILGEYVNAHTPIKCKCELCGAEGDGISFEIHHVNKLKNLKGKEQWEMAMIARKRKTLSVKGFVAGFCHQRSVRSPHRSDAGKPDSRTRRKRVRLDRRPPRWPHRNPGFLFFPSEQK